MNGSQFTFKERLYITEGTTVPNATYSFTIDNTVGVYKNTTNNIEFGSASTVTVPTGKPTITESVTFNNSSTKGTASGGDYDGKIYVEDTVTVDLSEISFKEPGIYFWKITKTKTGPDTLTNNRETLFAVVRVEDDNGTLKVDSIGLVHSDGATPTAQPAVSGKVQEVYDEFPAKEHNLTVSKIVAGSLGSRDEYFKFTVAISGATTISGQSLVVTTTSAPGTKDQTLYYGETADYVNPTSISLNATGAGSADFWMKHGESIQIKAIPDGASYTITESELNGYTATVDVSGDTDGVTRNINTAAAVVSDASLGSNATAQFTNTKESTTPTGINLQLAAPLFGIALVGLLLVVLLMSKRRENMYP